MKMHTQGERHMNTGVMLPPDKELPEAWREAWTRSFPSTLGWILALLTP